MKKSLAKKMPVLAKATARFYGLPQRDQMALKLMSLAVLVFLLYSVIWRPTQHYLHGSKLEAEQAYSDLVWMKENEIRARQLPKQNLATNTASQLAGKSLLSLISSSAQKYKVELQRFEPRGENRVNVWLDGVSFNQMMLWIGELGERHGVRVEQITVDQQANQPGLVAARMSFQI